MLSLLIDKLLIPILIFRNLCDSNTLYYLFVTVMDILPEGKNFRLVHDDELPSIISVLEQYLPDSLKVSSNLIINR